MSGWKDILAGMTAARSLERARSMIGQGTIYKLGAGGFKPDAGLWSSGNTCDCSGFSAWVLGIPRELPPGSGHWLQTTTYWQGGEFQGTPPFRQQPLTSALAGDLLVYPDLAGKQGHIGIVSATGADGPTKVVHCSAGNFRNTGDAIRETPPVVFTANASTRLMRVDFEVLRSIAGIGPAVDDDELPQPTGALQSLTLSHNPSLRLVVSGRLGLEETGEPMDGIAEVQRALGIHVTGMFDAATTRALQEFQGRVSLEPTGTLDAITLRRLDSSLMGRPAAVSTREAPSTQELPAPLSPLPITIRQDDNKFFARLGEGAEFLVGRRVSFLGNVGLMNTSAPGPFKYSADDHVAKWGHWTHLLEPTAMCESEGFFDRLNTYDRARFTFGFLQYAAHQPEGDFVRLLRRLIALPLATEYFSDLALVDGHVARNVDGTTTLLETSSSTMALMDFLNPGSSTVEDQEVENCAKLIHWCAQDPLHRAAQVEQGVLQLRESLKLQHRRYGLNGRTDVTCLIIFDIHHQGRASVNTVREALQRAGTEEAAWEELLTIGQPRYAERLTTLKREVGRLVSTGILGRRRYAAETNDFV